MATRVAMSTESTSLPTMNGLRVEVGGGWEGEGCREAPCDEMEFRWLGGLDGVSWSERRGLKLGGEVRLSRTEGMSSCWAANALLLDIELSAWGSGI